LALRTILKRKTGGKRLVAKREKKIPEGNCGRKRETDFVDANTNLSKGWFLRHLNHGEIQKQK